MDVSKNTGTPKWMVYKGKPYWNDLKWMIWGYHYFWKHPNAKHWEQLTTWDWSPGLGPWNFVSWEANDLWVLYQMSLVYRTVRPIIPLLMERGIFKLAIDSIDIKLSSITKTHQQKQFGIIAEELALLSLKNTLLRRITYPPPRHFEDNFHVPKVGYC